MALQNKPTPFLGGNGVVSLWIVMAWQCVAPGLVARVKTWLPRIFRTATNFRIGTALNSYNVVHVTEGDGGTILVTKPHCLHVHVYSVNGMFLHQLKICTTFPHPSGAWGPTFPHSLGAWGIAVASPGTGCYAGEVVMANVYANSVQVFSQQGKLRLQLWGTEGPKDGCKWQFPQGVAITPGLGPSGAVEVCVTERHNHCVQVFRLSDGSFLRQWGSLGVGPGQFNDPADVCISQAGEVFVSDFNNHRIQVFRLDGTFLRQWGKHGNQPGLFRFPWGITLQGHEVLVGDRDNHRMQQFRQDGAFVGKVSLGVQLKPIGLAVTQQGHVLVACVGSSTPDMWMHVFQ